MSSIKDFVIDNGVLTKYNGRNKKIIIPENVTSIGDSAFYNCSSLTDIKIPDSVTSIGDSAFYSCSSLTDIKIPDGVTSIGDYAFSWCNSLTDIKIPEGVTSIGDYAFSRCNSLTDIKIPEGVTSIGDYAFSGCSSLTDIKIPNSVTYIDNSAFCGCSSLTDIKIPDGVTYIGNNAFYKCCNLTNIKIPDGVTSIGDKAFSECSNLTDIKISDSIISIGDKAFYNCKGLADEKGFVIIRGILFNYFGTCENVIVPDSVTYIDNSAFSYCSSLIDIKIPDSVTSIGDSAFYECCNLTNIKIPDSVTSIGDKAFYNCKGLADRNGFIIIKGRLFDYLKTDENVIIPDNVTSIGNKAFYECSSLTDIKIPDSVTSIGDSAFCGCSSLTDIKIPDSVASIGDRAFCGCSSLTDIKIPDGITSIGDSAFYECCKLTNIKIPYSVTYIGNDAFFKCSRLTDIKIPDGVTSIGNSAFSGCNSLTNIKIPDGVTSIRNSVFSDCRNLTDIKIPDGVTSIGDYAFNWCSSLTNIKIPDGVTSIGDSTFYECCKLTNIKIPDGVTSIGDRAFCGCSSLTDIKIPDGVTYIGDSAFCGCSSLTDIKIPDGITSIGDSAFCGCSSLTDIKIPDGVTSIGDSAFLVCSSLTDIKIPDGVTSIGNSAFSGCNSLTNIKIPDGVTSIRNSVFSDCRSLTDIKIPDGVTYIGDYAFLGCSSLTDIKIPDDVTYIGSSIFSRCISLISITIPENITFMKKCSFEHCENLKHIYLLNPNCEFSDHLFGDFSDSRIPDSLLPNLDSIYKNLTDNDLKNYVLTKSSWPKLNNNLKADIFINRQKKSFLLNYSQCVDDAETLGNTMLVKLVENPSTKICNTMAKFMVLFSQSISQELVCKVYETLKSLKNGKKALKTIEEDELLQIKLNNKTEQSEFEKTFLNLIEKDKQSVLDITTKLKEYYSLTPSDLPKVIYADGSQANDLTVAYLLIAHEKLQKDFYKKNLDVVASYENYGMCETAKKVFNLLDYNSFQNALLTLANKYLGIEKSNRMVFLVYPICRYADETTIKKIANSEDMSCNSKNKFRLAALYSETKTAIFFVDLNKYAEMRGTDVDTIRDQYLSDVGLDENGGKIYDLGNQSVIARLQKDLSFIVELPNGKTAKSLPKKGSEPNKYTLANDDFSEMKKNVKNIVKNRANLLFNDFLIEKTKKADDWKKSYLKNPVLRHVASVLVWSQDDKTFTICDKGTIMSDGTPYTIGQTEIKVAHPMEMKNEDVERWQKYFTSNGLKQPFEQIWEPVIDASSILPDRYKDCKISVFRFMNMEKHGIYFYDENYHDIIGFNLYECELVHERTNFNRHSIDKDETFTLGEFSFSKFTRGVNHIVSILDKWTVKERILNDDISIQTLLDSFTLAQITEFINIAIDNNSTNVTAILLDYKNKKFSDFDAMNEFCLEL